jgi:pilus assembly protein CpaC
MLNKHMTVLKLVGIFSLLLLYLSAANPVWASGPSRVTVAAAQAEKLGVAVGKSVIVESKEPIKRISIALPDVADALVLSPRQIYIIGKTPGVTNLTLWGPGDNVAAVLDIEVLPDVNRLKEKLHQMLPKEKDIRVTASHDSLTLSGTVSGASVLNQVVAMAEAYAPAAKDQKSKIINLLEVGGVQQVMLEVRVSEISRGLGRKLGINFANLSASGRQFGLSLLDNLVQLPSQGGYPQDPLVATTSINGILQFLGGGATWTVFIDALKENGLIKVLAEPTLITLSGKSATFLAGGEFPIPVPQIGGGSTMVTIEYKPFGVGLSFTPTVLSNGKISMQVAPEVSELDFSNSVALQGFVIPSITTRRVSTTVELADGQSFAIAGLLKDEVREQIRKFPVLGDIPVLGALFRSSNFQKSETELIIIVTPRLVKPLDMAKQPLPTDQFVEPDDVDFYLLGRTEGARKETQAAPVGPAPTTSGKAGALDGNFGHIVR